MVKKKRVKLTFVITEKNLLLLQNMGFLNKRGKSTGKNYGFLINQAIYKYISTDHPSQNERLKERMIIANMNNLYDQRDKIEKQLQREARDLEAIRIEKPIEAVSDQRSKEVLYALEQEVCE